MLRPPGGGFGFCKKKKEKVWFVGTLCACLVVVECLDALLDEFKGREEDCVD